MDFERTLYKLFDVVPSQSTCLTTRTQQLGWPNTSYRWKTGLKKYTSDKNRCWTNFHQLKVAVQANLHLATVVNENLNLAEKIFEHVDFINIHFSTRNNEPETYEILPIKWSFFIIIYQLIQLIQNKHNVPLERMNSKKLCEAQQCLCIIICIDAWTI